MFKSSYLGLITYLFTIFIDRRFSIRLNSLVLGISLLLIILASEFILLLEHSETIIPYLKSLALWFLPIFYFTFGVKDLTYDTYLKLLIVMVIYIAIEVVLINFTTIALFDDDRLRTSTYGFIRGEGFSHNSSMSSALICAIFLKLNFKKEINFYNLLITLLGIVLLGSGVGILLFVLAFILSLNKNYIFLFFFAILLLFLLVFGIENSLNLVGSLHPKVSNEYIGFLLENKLHGMENLWQSDTIQILFGSTVFDGLVRTSGDFGYLVMVTSIGLIPSMILMYGIFIMLIRAKQMDNFFPFLILLIASVHYPIFVDPISAYILAQFALGRRKDYEQ